MEKFTELKDKVASMQADVLKFSEGNKAAGTRIRKSLQEVKVLAQLIRTQVTEAKNSK